MQPPHDSLLRTCLRKAVYGAARGFAVRPATGAEAAALCETLASHGIPSTLGKLSKAGDDPFQIVAEYQGISNRAGSGNCNDFYLSVKPPALDFNPDHAEAIVATARANGQSVHFDAHGFAHADATLVMLAEVMKRLAPEKSEKWSYGLTLPSRWKRSAADARWLACRGIRPRLVKGDFRGAPADEVEAVRGFLALVDELAGKVPELAAATHDCDLAREVATRCRRKGTAVEFELFFGRPSSGMIALSRQLDVPLRFYVPYGDTLLVYFIRDLLSNPHKMLRPSSIEIFGSQERKLARIIGAG